MKPKLLFLAALVALPALAATAAGDQRATAADSAQGQAKFATVCAACHNADANSIIPANPKLAAQHPEYLVKQLQDFKSGKRANPIMRAMASMLSEADMRNVAAWAASQIATPSNGPRDQDAAQAGERIYRGGIADRRIAACSGCHGPDGAGVPAQYPRLAGQHADYTIAQLTAFRDGARTNSVPMSQEASKLNDREIRAVAAFIAGMR